MIKKYSQFSTEIHEDGFISPTGRFVPSENYESHSSLATKIINKDPELKKEFSTLREQQEKVYHLQQDKRINPIYFLVDKGWVRLVGTLYKQVGFEFSEKLDFVKRMFKNLLPDYEGDIHADNLVFDSSGKFKRITFSGLVYEFMRWGGAKSLTAKRKIYFKHD